jgi:hypothetical protein
MRTVISSSWFKFDVLGFGVWGGTGIAHDLDGVLGHFFNGR